MKEMDDQANALAHQLASDAARSDIESYCEVAALTDVDGKTHWYDLNQPASCCESEHARYVPVAMEYLVLTGRIERHSTHANWVRILIEEEETLRLTSLPM